MKSKPVYQPLELDRTAKRHVIFAQGQGLTKALDLAESARDTTDIIEIEEGLPDSYTTTVVSGVLADAALNIAFYASGPETFLWEVEKCLRAAGVEQDRILLHLAGSKARRVYCVHCRTINEEVTTTVHRCEHCAMYLTVRDHFSRRMGCYMGVVINAEDPAVIPEPEIIYV
jgi:hypothetical protein